MRQYISILDNTVFKVSGQWELLISYIWPKPERQINGDKSWQIVNHTANIKNPTLNFLLGYIVENMNLTIYPHLTSLLIYKFHCLFKYNL